MCTVVSVACMYAKRMRGCEGDGNVGVMIGRGVVAVSGGLSIWVVHVVQVWCLLLTTC